MIKDSKSSGSADPAPATSHGLSFGTALGLTVLFTLIAVGGSFGVSRSSLSTGIKGSLAVITLTVVVGLGYSIFQLVLALVATTGERRWFSRKLSERRSGERARKPPAR